MAVIQTLTLTEIAGSQNVADNTSRVRILWKSTQTDGSYNHSVRTGKYWVTTPDGRKTEYEENYVLHANAEVTILDKTITVTHKDTGPSIVAVQTWMDANITGGLVQLDEALTLEPIIRASEITSAKDVILGRECSVKWTPRSEAFRYKLKFSMGSKSHTTEAIHPGRTTEYTYADYQIPLTFANQIPNSITGTMTVTLYTYADEAATKLVAEGHSTTFTVTLLAIDMQPTVEMTLTPVSTLPSAFSGLYIQQKTKVKASLSAQGEYGATIRSSHIQVEGAIYDSEDGYTSDYLTQYGRIDVKGCATDSRSNVGSTTKAITVIGYSAPQLLAASGEQNVVVARCDKDGNLSDSGTYLLIRAKRSYSKVLSGGVQRNFCKIQYRYKTAGGTYSSWTTILAADTLTSDEIKTGALLSGVLSDQSSYAVQVQAIDDIGEYARTTVTLPTGKVYMHRDGKRRSLAFGGYVEEDNTFSTAEDITFRAKGPIRAEGGGNIDILTLGEEITATASAPIRLNEYITPGNYYAESSENIQDLHEIAGGFSLRVRQVQTTGSIRQELICGENTWTRSFDGTAWSRWLRFMTTAAPGEAVSDYVVEAGLSDGWEYKKWKSGTYQAFTWDLLSPTGYTQNETLYISDKIAITMPFQIESAFVAGTTNSACWIVYGGISEGGTGFHLRLMSDKPFDSNALISVSLVVMGHY